MFISVHCITHLLLFLSSSIKTEDWSMSWNREAWEEGKRRVAAQDMEAVSQLERELKEEGIIVSQICVKRIKDGSK